MKTTKILTFTLLLSALLLQACGGLAPDTQNVIQTAIAQTEQISLLQTAAAGGGGADTGNADNGEAPSAPTDTPTPSQTSTITLSPTPSIPMVSVSDNTNCRTGPSASYGFVVLVIAGQPHEVLKTYNGANYVVIKSPTGVGDCWLWLQYANQTDFSAYNLPVATQPPTPTPTFTPTPSYVWDGDWKIWVESGGLTQCSMHINRSGLSIDGTYDCGAWTGTISGTLSADLSYASGTWTNDVPQNGSFEWQRKKNANQFIGNYNGSYAWCGARAGASQPSPCVGP